MGTVPVSQKHGQPHRKAKTAGAGERSGGWAGGAAAGSTFRRPSPPGLQTAVKPAPGAAVAEGERLPLASAYPRPRFR